MARILDERFGTVDVATYWELIMPADIVALPLLECHSVPVDQQRLITLLFGITSEEQTLADTMRSVVWRIGPDGQSEIWRPGKDYPGSSIWFAEPGTGILLGNDFHNPDAVYACKLDGTHIASFRLPLLWDNPIQPWRFRATQQGIEYFDATGNLLYAADIATLISAAHGTKSTEGARLAADWRPRSLLLPASYPDTEKILLRLNRDGDQMRLAFIKRQYP